MAPTSGQRTRSMVLYTIRDKVLSNKMDVAGPSSFSTIDLVLCPDVGAIFTPPVAGYVMGILLSWVLNSGHESEAIMRQPGPHPGVHFERGALCNCRSRVSHSIFPCCA